MGTNPPRFSLNGDGKTPSSDVVERQRQVAKDLSARFKQLNSLWLDAEESLKTIPLPVDAHIQYASDDVYDEHPGGPQIVHCLGFVKSSGGWRICNGSRHDEYPEHGFDWKPITECTLDLRVKLIPHLGKLREKVFEAAEQCVPRLDQALEDFRKTLSSW